MCKAYNMDERTGKMFNNEQYSDIILQVEDQTFFAHRLILSSWSDVFKTMLCDPTWQPNKQAVSSGESTRYDEQGQRRVMHQNLVEEELCAKVFEDFLKFMYTSSVSITTVNVLPLIRLADKYMVVELRNLCEKFLADMRHNVDAIISLVSESSRAGMASVYKTYIQGLRNNFNRLTTEQLERFDAEILVALLDSGFDLVVNDEYTVFKKIESWLEVCEDDDIFIQIIRLIRFPYMKASQLSELTTSSAVYKRALTLIPNMNSSIWQMKSLYDEGSLSNISEEFPCPRLYLDLGRQHPNASFIHVQASLPRLLPMYSLLGQTAPHTCTRWVCRGVEGRMFYTLEDKNDTSSPVHVNATLQDENIEVTITPQKPLCQIYHIALEATQNMLPCVYFSWMQTPTVKTYSRGNRNHHTFSWKPVKVPTLSAWKQDTIQGQEIRLRVVLIEENAEAGDCEKEAHDEEKEAKDEEDSEEGEETGRHHLFGSESVDSDDNDDNFVECGLLSTSSPSPLQLHFLAY